MIYCNNSLNSGDAFTPGEVLFDDRDNLHETSLNSGDIFTPGDVCNNYSMYNTAGAYLRG